MPLADAYRQTGSFSYSASTPPDKEAPGGVVTTGQPIFLDDTRLIDVLFRYRFSSRYAHSVHGTIAFSAELSSDASSWHHRYVLAKTRPFSGDIAVIRAIIPVNTLVGIQNELAVASGSPSDTFAAVLSPTIRVSGLVNGKPITSTFTPALPFSVTKALIKLNVTAVGPVPGATAAPASPSSLLEAALEPVTSETIPGIGPRAVSIARIRLSVVDLRGIAIGLAGLLALVILTRPLRRRRDALSPERRLAARAGCVVVDVVSVAPFAGAPVAMADFSSLLRLDRYLERPILDDRGSGAFAVEDGGRIYLHRPAEAVGGAEPTPGRKPRPRPPRPLRWIGALLAAAIAASMVVSFTAANAVPLSNAGVSVQTLALSQLAPAQCAALNLTRLVVATGSSTTGPNGGDLILGRAGGGSFSLTGGSGNDCIVAGGGPGTKNTIDGGGGSDVCIGAPGAQNTFKRCEASY